MNHIKQYIKTFVNKLCSCVDPATAILGVILIGAIVTFGVEKSNMKSDITELKSAYTSKVAYINSEHTKKVNALEAKIVKLQKLNKALVAQLDTKAEQVADVETYILKTTKTIGADVAKLIAENVVKFGNEYNVPVPIVVSIMQRESHFNLQSVGSVGERGLMQVRFSVWQKKLDIKSKYDLHNIAVGIEKGVQVLDISLKDSKYDLHKTIRQYNSGSTSHGSETYVANVMECMGKYEAHTSLRQIIKDKQKREAQNGGKNDKLSSSDGDKTARTDTSFVQPGGIEID